MKLKYSAKAHGYWLNGRRCKSPSAIAKVPDDGSALDKWRRRQTAIGLAMRPELLTEIAANVDDKQSVDAICERAMDHAGASSGRNWGSAVHLVIDRHIGGQTLLDTAETLEVRQRWTKLLADHDLEVVTSEAVIVHDDLHIAGRFDQIVKHKPSGQLFVGDVKTGAEADKYLHAHAVQLWLYASAPLMAVGPQGDQDFEIDTFTDMLGVSQSVGFVFHLPQEGEASVIPVDLTAGHHCFENVIRPTWAWRERQDLRAEMPTKPARIEPLHVVADKPSPTEGPTVDVDALRERYVSLSPVGRTWVDAKRDEALRAGVDFHLAGNYSARRARIMDGLIALASAEADDDDALRAIVRQVIADEFVDWPTVPAGAVVGSLGATEAAAFAAACDLFLAGRYSLLLADGGPVLVEVAA